MTDDLRNDVQFGIAAINDPDVLGEEGKQRLWRVDAALANDHHDREGRWRRGGWHTTRCWAWWAGKPEHATCICDEPER